MIPDAPHVLLKQSFFKSYYCCLNICEFTSSTVKGCRVRGCKLFKKYLTLSPLTIHSHLPLKAPFCAFFFKTFQLSFLFHSTFLSGVLSGHCSSDPSPPPYWMLAGPELLRGLQTQCTSFWITVYNAEKGTDYRYKWNSVLTAANWKPDPLTAAFWRHVRSGPFCALQRLHTLAHKRERPGRSTFTLWETDKQTRLQLNSHIQIFLHFH